jgi:hypothetical protein
MGRGTARLLAIAATASLALLLSAAGAGATFHLIKVREVFPGSIAHPDSSYVELQAYNPFQNQVQLGELHVYDAAGSDVSHFTPAGPLANGANQATAVIADTGFAAAFPGVTADSIDSSLNLSPAAGAVCWPITEPPFEDCVSWGAFTGNASLPDSAGTPFHGSGASGAIGDGKAIVRSIGSHCTTALDDADDTDDSAADFSEAAPNPRPNSAPITEAVCIAAGGTTTPSASPAKKKKKCKKHKRSGAGSGTTGSGGGPPAYAAKKKKCKKHR